MALSINILISIRNVLNYERERLVSSVIINDSCPKIVSKNNCKCQTLRSNNYFQHIVTHHSYVGYLVGLILPA